MIFNLKTFTATDKENDGTIIFTIEGKNHAFLSTYNSIKIESILERVAEKEALSNSGLTAFKRLITKFYMKQECLNNDYIFINTYSYDALFSYFNVWGHSMTFKLTIGLRRDVKIDEVRRNHAIYYSTAEFLKAESGNAKVCKELDKVILVVNKKVNATMLRLVNMNDKPFTQKRMMPYLELAGKLKTEKYGFI